MKGQHQPQPTIMIAVDQRELQSLRDEMTALRRAIEGVTMTPRPEWISLATYAEQVGRSEKTVRNWIRDGKLDTKRQGTVIMVKAA
ncbi:hypothetical protein [Ketogulonicigenium vulgare]|uniref:hypothetical protein n=1 Tax=Ketogulonicigenium vulgare TaxID=92945 RepID=UPI00235A3E7D|nr:hypothetical protein [Ketogulonicigenium vulgare]